MTFTDTHCHIHESDYPLNAQEVIERAQEYGVNRLICVGVNGKTSKEAVAFAQNHDNCWASVGLHPHEAEDGETDIKIIEALLNPIPQLSSTDLTAGKIKAIGECGLDYFYNNSPKERQVEILTKQLELADHYDLPVIFHVRQAFDDFWPIFDQFSGIKGVLHSFTDSKENLNKALERQLYIGVNGISTFTRVDEQKEMFKMIPLTHLLLETDAPFLTPVPKRGTVNEPAFVTFVAYHIADLQHITLEELSVATNRNATTLFNL